MRPSIYNLLSELNTLVYGILTHVCIVVSLVVTSLLYYNIGVQSQKEYAMPTEYEKMIAGDFYKPSDPELRALAAKSREKQWAFNAETDRLKRAEIVKSWFGSTGENLAMNPQFVTDYGVNIHLGENFYSNWNLTMLDVCPIRIGDNAMIGPNCQFLTPLHPLDPTERNSGLEYGAPITIGDNFWAGGGVTILAGVSLWDNVLGGAGAVVTKSFVVNVVIAGNPSRVIKEIPVKKD